MIVDAGGSVTAAAIAQTGGTLQVDGTVTLAGAATVDSSYTTTFFTVNPTGTFAADGLALSGAGGNDTQGYLGGTVTLNSGGAATDSNVFTVSQMASVVVGGMTEVTGETAVTGTDTTLVVAEDGSLTTDTLRIETGSVAVRPVGSGTNPGSLIVNDSTTIGDGAAAGGTLTIDGLASIGDTTVQSDGTLSVGAAGDLTTGTLATAGTTTLDAGGLLIADGTTVSGGTTTLNGTATLGATTVSGGALTVGGTVDTDDGLDARQDLTVTGGAVTVNAGGTLLAASLEQSGGTVTVAENAGTDGTLNLAGANVTGGTLTVDGVLAATGDVAVSTAGRWTSTPPAR